MKDARLFGPVGRHEHARHSHRPEILGKRGRRAFDHDGEPFGFEQAGDDLGFLVVAAGRDLDPLFRVLGHGLHFLDAIAASGERGRLTFTDGL